MTWQLIALIFTMLVVAWQLSGLAKSATARTVVAVLLILGAAGLLILALGTPALAGDGGSASVPVSEKFGGLLPTVA